MKKTQLALIFILLFSLEGFSQQTFQRTIVEKGIGLGNALAIVVSWHKNKSLLWAIFHGICGWLYVGYYAINRK